MEQKIIDRATAWANSPYIDEQDRLIVQGHLDTHDEAQLQESFHKDLTFGTGGIRSLMGQGTNRINRYTIQRATQAFANALIDQFQEGMSLCIGFDCRRFSQLFAQEAAQVMAGNGIRVYLFNHMTPTPLLSYAVRYFKSRGGIMITASHNPRDYNGYKVYWDDGCQVTPPHDMAIINHYQKLACFGDIQSMDFHKAKEQGKISLIDEKCEESYYRMIQQQCLNPTLCQEQGHQLRIAFTPLHGTGDGPVTLALKQIGFHNVYSVPEQKRPDQDFTTLSSPNPEDASALEKVMALMRAKKAPLAMATDPDTDRLGVVANHQDKLYILNGNQIGLLLLYYILQTRKKNQTLGPHPLFIKTIVTSDLLARVAKSFGCTVENTLTGFKWICGKIKEYEEKKIPFNFIFGTEESFGYLSHDHCRDKDGVNACALMAEVALFHQSQGRTLVEALDFIYDQYGYSCECLFSLYYEGVKGSQKIERIMDYFRHIKEHFPDLKFMKEKMSRIEDYLHQSVIEMESEKKTKLTIPVSNVLGIHFKSGNKLYLRPSGTESKIKFYFMVVEEEGDLVKKKRRASEKVKVFEKFIKAQCEKI